MKNIRLVLSSFGLMLLVVVFIRCSKETSLENQESFEDLEFKKTKLYDRLVAYDTIGKLHNEAVRLVMDKLEAGKETLRFESEEELFNFILLEVNNKLNNIQLVVEGEEFSFANYSNITYENYKSSLENYVMPDEMARVGNNSSNFSAKAIQYKIDQALGKLIKANLKTKNEEKALLLTSAIYKNSVEFWEEFALEYNESKYYKTAGGGSGLCWACVGYADAAGAYSGAQFGSVLGPGGTFGGALAIGIMNSAISGAIATGWNQYFN